MQFLKKQWEREAFYATSYPHSGGIHISDVSILQGLVKLSRVFTLGYFETLSSMEDV